ncbi:diaminobutyrate acetyltransferase, partial [Streptomyces sp. TRM76130]|nr:diaminobutyrate acetyltransferase [Streptomyces sp. TRM76130]
MTAAQADLLIDRPRVTDGATLWRIARDSKVLDLNSSYAYLLWCRDFAATSAVAR